MELTVGRRCYLEGCDDPACEVCTAGARVDRQLAEFRRRYPAAPRKDRVASKSTRDGKARLAGERKRAGTSSSRRVGPTR